MMKTVKSAGLLEVNLPEFKMKSMPDFIIATENQ